jgi:hypothetical protein
MTPEDVITIFERLYVEERGATVDSGLARVCGVSALGDFRKQSLLRRCSVGRRLYCMAGMRSKLLYAKKGAYRSCRVANAK